MKKQILILLAILSILPFSVYADAQDDFATRAEACKGLMEMINSTDTLISDEEIVPVFSDTTDENVLAIAKLGIMQGVSETTFEPNALITRQEMAVVLCRLIDKIHKDSDIDAHPIYYFDDNWKIADWARDSVEYLYYHEIIKGTEPYVISPDSKLTMEQLKLLVDRVIKGQDKFVAKKETEEFSWAIEPKYNGLGPDTRFSGGLCAVVKDGKYGYINTDGEKVIGFKYDDADAFSCGMARVCQNGKYGYINKKGDVIIPFEYGKNSRAFSEDLVLLEKDGKYGFADKNGNIVIPFDYEHGYDFSEGIASVKKDNHYGFIDKQGEKVIDFKFHWASSFKEGFARVEDEGRYNLIDHTGEMPFELDFEYIFEFNEGTAVIVENSRFNIINNKGEVVLPYLSYGLLFPANDGLIRFHPFGGPQISSELSGMVTFSVGSFYEGAYGYLDKNTLEVAIEPNKTYDANDFYEGLASVSSHSNRTDRTYRSYMDKNGKFIYPNRGDDPQKMTDYDDDCFYIQRFSEGYAAVVNQQGKLGFVKNPLF